MQRENEFKKQKRDASVKSSVIFMDHIKSVLNTSKKRKEMTALSTDLHIYYNDTIKTTKLNIFIIPDCPCSNRSDRL